MKRVEFLGGPLDSQQLVASQQEMTRIYRDVEGAHHYDEDFVHEGPKVRRVFRYYGLVKQDNQNVEPNLTALTDLIVGWGFDRRITVNSNPQAQTLKLVSEAGELADAVLKNDKHAIEDAIGDVYVTLVMVASTAGLSVRECVEAAYNQIKNRKGTLTPEGVFVKEE